MKIRDGQWAASLEDQRRPELLRRRAALGRLGTTRRDLRDVDEGPHHHRGLLEVHAQREHRAEGLHDAGHARVRRRHREQHAREWAASLARVLQWFL